MGQEMIEAIDFRWYMYFLILSGLFIGSVIGFTIASFVEKASGIVGLETPKITVRINENVSNHRSTGPNCSSTI
jgi:hypothetical protein